MQTQNYIDAGKFLFVALAILALSAQTLFAEQSKSALRAYTDLSSIEAQDILWLGRILYSESKVREEQIMVAWVVRNRAESSFRGADSYKDVALSPSQFSGLWPGDPQYKNNMSPNYSDTNNKEWQQALAIAQAVYFADESLRPIGKSVRHFYSPIAITRDPHWASNKKPILTMRNDRGAVRFAFYDNVR